ncbi:MAG: hypothetical protein Q4F74_02790 [Synergistaceae bacterium]|nr:hypothetical protein [Synergistaceae bacterium]
MAQDNFIGAREVKTICEAIDGVKGAINAQAAVQNISSEVVVTLARLDERMGQIERSFGNTQKTLVGLVISILLSLVTLVIKGALLK